MHQKATHRSCSEAPLAIAGILRSAGMPVEFLWVMIACMMVVQLQAWKALQPKHGTRVN